MRRSHIVCAGAIILAAVLLARREVLQQPAEQESYGESAKEAEAAVSPGVEAPPTKTSSMRRTRVDQRNRELRMKAEMKAFFEDYAGLDRYFDEFYENAMKSGSFNGWPEDGLARRREINDRLARLSSAQMRFFLTECFNTPDLSERTTNGIRNNILGTFIKANPTVLAEMLSTSPELFKNDSKTIYETFSRLVFHHNTVRNDMPKALECLASSDSSFLTNYVSDFLSDPKAEMGAEVHGAIREYARNTQQFELIRDNAGYFAFGNGLRKLDYEDVTSWLASADLSSDELAVATKDMSEKVRVEDTPQWLDWLAKNEMPDALSKGNAFQLAAAWTEKDPEAAGNWLNSVPQSPVKSAAVSAYAAKTYAYDPQAAMEWIQTLPQGSDRTKALETIYQGMAEDSGEAKAFASKNGLTE